MTAIDDLLQNNERYAARFDRGDAPGAPARRIAVVACMDARMNPFALLGLEEGDAHVIRNAGGVVTDDVIRSLAISQHELGTCEVMLIHHTRCGLLALDDGEFRERLRAESGEAPAWSTRAFADLEDDVRDSIRRVRESPFLPRTDAVRGFVYDVDSGRLREVAEPPV